MHRRPVRRAHSTLRPSISIKNVLGTNELNSTINWNAIHSVQSVFISIEAIKSNNSTSSIVVHDPPFADRHLIKTSQRCYTPFVPNQAVHQANTSFHKVSVEYDRTISCTGGLLESIREKVEITNTAPATHKKKCKSHCTIEQSRHVNDSTIHSASVCGHV